MAPPPLTLCLFGPLRVTVRGAPLPRVRTRSVEWLLALLTLRHGHTVSRGWLAGTLWPASSERRAMHNLRDDLVRLRQALGAEGGRIQSPTRDLLTLDLTGAQVDLLQFDRGVQGEDEASLREAVAVYRGPLLEGCVEEWVLLERETRAEQCLCALEVLAERAEGRGDHGAAIGYLRRAAALDPLRDSVHRRLMANLSAGGDPAAAVEVYRTFRERLQKELLAQPDAATTALFQEIRADGRHRAAAAAPAFRGAGVPAPAGTGFPLPWSAPPGEDAPPHASDHGPRERESGAGGAPLNAPVCPPPRPVAPLIGREDEVLEVLDLLRRHRLVTLTGGGGVGKTRLALELATRAGEAGAGGAVWVELAALADGTLILPTVAAALGIRPQGAEDPETLQARLVARLSDGTPLLALDNCEHLLDAAAELVQGLLERCPELRVLATSRQRLGLTGEVAWRVPPLAAPDPEQLPEEGVGAVANALRFPAIRLFAERAAAAREGFRLTSREEAVAVCRISHRLDGIPLALELAAARVCVLTPGQLVERLDDRFRLLTRGARGALPRHQTLRALIDWSYDLLSEAEARLLRRLAVFSGGWTLEAAEAVCGEECRVDVLDLLDSLVEKSLVLVEEEAAGLRYGMLETLRQYGWERLAASGELAATRKRHREWYLQLAEQADAAASQPEVLQEQWLTRLEAELDNLRAALGWCQEEAEANPSSQGAEAGLRLATALGWPWICRGDLTEGLQWLEGMLARGSHLSASVRAPALRRAGHLARDRGDLERWHTFVQAARREYEQVLMLARREGNVADIAHTLQSLAAIADQDDDLDAAWTYSMEARPLFEELAEPVGIAHTLECMAGVYLKRGDFRAARPLLEERLAICRKLGDPTLLVHALGGLGHVERDAGNYARAEALYRESLLLRRELRARFALAQSLEDLAGLAGRQRQSERAIRLLGAAEAFCEMLGARPPVAGPTEYERTVREGRAVLGEAAFAAIWAEGRTMSPDEATEYALAEE